MMNRTRALSRQSRSHGFSLIEVMISIVLGMILIGAVLSLVVTSLQSNAETIRSTRLTQEMRTLVEVIGREAERARFMADPLANIGNPPDPDDPTVGATNPNGLIEDDTDGCLGFSYFEPRGAGTTNTAVTFELRDGALFVGRQEDAPLETWTDPDGDDRQRTALIACGDEDAIATRLSSPEIVVTQFDVRVLDDVDLVNNDSGDPTPDGWVDCDQPDSILVLQIAGRFAAGNDAFVRSVSDRIRIGSTDLKVHAGCYN